MDGPEAAHVLEIEPAASASGRSALEPKSSPSRARSAAWSRPSGAAAAASEWPTLSVPAASIPSGSPSQPTPGPRATFPSCSRRSDAWTPCGGPRPSIAHIPRRARLGTSDETCGSSSTPRGSVEGDLRVFREYVRSRGRQLVDRLLPKGDVVPTEGVALGFRARLDADVETRDEVAVDEAPRGSGEGMDQSRSATALGNLECAKTSSY
jgi:hypothetical protein